MLIEYIFPSTATVIVKLVGQVTKPAADKSAFREALHLVALGDPRHSREYGKRTGDKMAGATGANLQTPPEDRLSLL